MTSHSEQPASARNFQRRYFLLAWGIPGFVFAFLAFMVFRYAVDAPYYDQYAYVSLFVKAQRHELTWASVWVQYNEHRLLLPNLVMLTLARWSGWNIRWELATSLVLGAGIYAVHAAQVRRAAARTCDAALPWLLPVIAIAVFSLRQYENWLWGFQLQIFLNVLLTLVGFTFLTSRALTWTTLLAAALCGVGATFSFGNGLLYWPISLIVLLALAPRAQRRPFGLAWIVAFALILGVYFYKYSIFPGTASVSYMLHHLLKFVLFLLVYVGSFAAGESRLLAAIAGSVGLILFSLASWRLARDRQADWNLLAFYWALAAYALASGLLADRGRISSGVTFALTSRYTTISELFWIATLVLTYLWARQSESAVGKEPLPGSAKQLTRRGLYAAAAFGIVFACVSIRCRQNFQQWHDTKIIVQQRLLNEPLQSDNPERYWALFPSSSTLNFVTSVTAMKQYHLGIFHDANAPSRR